MSASTAPATEFSLNIVRPESTQLVFVFFGARVPQSLDALQFMRDSGIGERNVVFVEDPYHGCYLRGLSEAFPEFDGVVAWQRQLLAATYPHVNEVFCFGVSAGAAVAMHSACRLGARAAWAFGARLVKLGVLDARDRAMREVYTEVIGRPTLNQATPEERARLLDAFQQPDLSRRRWDMTGNPDLIVDHDAVRRLVETVRSCQQTTTLHLHYASINTIDRRFAEAFRDCPQVQLHPVDLPPGSTYDDDFRFEDPGHNVLLILNRMGLLTKLFKPYLGGNAPAA